LFQRALNRAGRPFGILPFSLAWEPDEAAYERSRTFDEILRRNTWRSTESVSGPGSELRRTSRYRKALIEFLRRNAVESFFDAPCGDLNWMASVLDQLSVRYIGGDVSPAVLEAAKCRCPSLDLRQFDICEDEFPAVDVWHCRDTFLHLSFRDIWKALQNAAKSDVKVVLLTTHRSRLLRNVDVSTGGARPLDLRKPPFNFPAAVEYLPDSSGWGFPRAVGVWPMDVIRTALSRSQDRSSESEVVRV
jgi:SAM-dependent methyltransferase